MFKHTPDGIITMYATSIHEIKEHITEGYAKITDFDFSDPDFKAERMMQIAAVKKSTAVLKLENMDDNEIREMAEDLYRTYVEIDNSLLNKLLDLKEIHRKNIIVGFHPIKKPYQKELLSRLDDIDTLHISVKAICVIFQRDNLEATYGKNEGARLIKILRQKWNMQGKILEHSHMEEFVDYDN